MTLKNNIKLHILGAGPAGLATGYYAKKNNIPLMLYEGSNEVGGNCKTIVQGQYRYDTGAHRFHDKHDFVTEEIKNLVGDDFKKVNSPSKIFFKDRMINFPLELSAAATKAVLSPCRIRSIFPLFTSQRRAVLSFEIEINAFPSLENITLFIINPCPSSFLKGVFEISSSSFHRNI